MVRNRLCAASLAVILTVPAGWARKPGEPIKPGWNLFSRDQDIQLGREYAAQISRQVQVIDNRELQDYITRMGRKLAATPEAGDYPYSFTLINDPSINAFALPGGPTFIHSGLILAADNEAQVAGVVGHEIAHVALRHGTNQASKAQFMQIPAILAGIATGSNLAAALTQIGAQGFLLKFSRTAEDQADALGARMMAQAGYNPVEMARFFEKLEAQGGSRAPQFLSSHPNPGNRVKAVEAEIAVMPRLSFTDGNQAEFERVKAQLAKLPPPRQQQQPNALSGGGASPSGTPAASQQRPESLNVPPPSGRFRAYRGPNVSFNYPDNWEVFGTQNSANMTIAPRAGVIQNANGHAIAYGAVAGIFPSPGRRNLANDTRALIEQLIDGNPGLRVTSNPRRARVDRRSALLTDLQGESPLRGQREQNVLLTVERPDGVFYVVFIAPEREFGDYQRTFDEIARSLRFAN